MSHRERRPYNRTTPESIRSKLLATGLKIHTPFSEIRVLHSKVDLTCTCGKRVTRGVRDILRSPFACRHCKMKSLSEGRKEFTGMRVKSIMIGGVPVQCMRLSTIDQ